MQDQFLPYAHVRVGHAQGSRSRHAITYAKECVMLRNVNCGLGILCSYAGQCSGWRLTGTTAGEYCMGVGESGENNTVCCVFLLIIRASNPRAWLASLEV